MRRVVFFDHLHAGATVLSDLVDVGALHQAEADICMPQTVGCTRSAFPVETKLLFVEYSFEKLALPLGKNEIGGFGPAPLFPKDIGVHGSLCGRVHAINARRAKPASTIVSEAQRWHNRLILTELDCHFAIYRSFCR